MHGEKKTQAMPAQNTRENNKKKKQIRQVNAESRPKTKKKKTQARKRFDCFLEMFVHFLSSVLCNKNRNSLNKK